MELASCDRPVSHGSFTSPLAPWLSPEPEAAAAGSCCTLQVVPSVGDFRHFPGMKARPFHQLASLRYMRHGKKMSVSPWAMGKISLCVQQLETLSRDQIRVSYPSTLMIPSRLDVSFGVLLIYLFGIMCLLFLCLDCPRSLVLPRAMSIICTPAFLAASSSVFP